MLLHGISLFVVPLLGLGCEQVAKAQRLLFIPFGCATASAFYYEPSFTVNYPICLTAIIEGGVIVGSPSTELGFKKTLYSFGV
jgi:hypothetical protein